MSRAHNTARCEWMKSELGLFVHFVIVKTAVSEFKIACLDERKSPYSAPGQKWASPLTFFLKALL